MEYFTQFYLDQEKDMIVELYKEQDHLFYILRTPNHTTGNLISNLAKMCDLKISFDDAGLKVIKGEIPCYYNDEGNLVYIFRLKDTKVANIYPNGMIERKASIPAISKTLMSQTKNYQLDFQKTVVKTFIQREYKFHTDLHTHMNANLTGDMLIALGIKHQILYPYYYVKKLKLKCSASQIDALEKQRSAVAKTFENSSLEGKYLQRRIDDTTYINFADLILNNIENAAYNIPRIRNSLAVMKDGQAVFTNLEKVYLYRYVFTKGIIAEKKLPLEHIDEINDHDIQMLLKQMLLDKTNPVYQNNSLFQDKLLWIARKYQKEGIQYVEISDTTLVKKEASIHMLEEVHSVMPAVYQETGVMIRFLASFRRIPLTIVRDSISANNYKDNLEALYGVMMDPYIAGSDIVGEEINDIRELKPLIQEITHLASMDDSFVIRIHAGENDSLRDNVYNSIRCVEESLEKNQKMPHVRIGHGLYTANLSTVKGKAFLEYLKEKDVVLEFQITSNVRLNNLSDLSKHPLKQYLHAGVDCVQGSDGGALYGTNSIDEQLSLEKILQLTNDDLAKMCESEKKIIAFSMHAFIEKKKKLEHALKTSSMETLYAERMQSYHVDDLSKDTSEIYDSSIVFKDKIVPLPRDKFPVIIAGGSFNNDTHITKTRKEYCALIDTLIEKCDPDKVVFVIGASLKGYEKYLLDHAKKFEIFAFVPATISKARLHALQRCNVSIRVAIEPSSMGIYKSIAYEIFKRNASVLLALDGNSSVVNLVQEAKNAKYPCRIFVNPHCKMLKKKADSLLGYVTLLHDSNNEEDVLKYIHA